MPRIHPTAIVDPRAILSDDVEIGPWCLVEGEVRIGPGTRLLERVSLRGPLTLGGGNVLYPHICIGLNPQHRKFGVAVDAGAGIVIGSDNVLRENVTINGPTGAEPTRLGDRNYLMANAHVGHDCQVGNDCTLANNAMLAGHAVLQDQVTMGGGAGVHQFARVGRLAMIGGNSGVNLDLPPFCVVPQLKRVGALNLVGLRRSGQREHLAGLRDAFRIFFVGGHTNANALRLIDERWGDNPLCTEFAAFIRQSKRGITTYLDRSQRAATAGESVPLERGNGE